MADQRDPKEEDVRAGDSEEGADAPKLKEAMDKAETFQKAAPGGGTHEEEVGNPVWGEEQGDLTGQEGKQSQHGGSPA